MVTSFIKYLFKLIWCLVLQIKTKNGKRNSNLNFNAQLFWKSKNHLVWCFMSQLKYWKETQNFISNFVFQFIKKMLWHFRYTDSSTVGIFFSGKELFSWTYLSKKTPRRTKILIFPVWNKILKIWSTLFEIIQIEVQHSKMYFKIFYDMKLGFLEIT